MPPKRSTRRGKPVFEVVGDPAEDTRTGWVYRSETASRAAAQSTPPPRFTAVPAPTPAAATAAQPSLMWVAGAMAIMSLPIVITAGMMIAPMALVWAARKSTNG